MGDETMIDYLPLDCGCVWDSGSWDLCLFHRHKEGGMTTEGPVPLSGLDSEPVPIFNAPSLDPYEASTRQAEAERNAPKANHCPTCTCKK